MAGYLVKLARELTGSARKDQVPVDAPSHFRRLRASRGLLPAAFTGSGEYTGEMRQKPKEQVECDLVIENELLLRFKRTAHLACHHGGDGRGVQHVKAVRLELDSKWAPCRLGRGQQGEARPVHDPLGRGEGHHLQADGSLAASNPLTTVNGFGIITMNGKPKGDGQVPVVREGEHHRQAEVVAVRGSSGDLQGDVQLGEGEGVEEVLVQSS